MKFRIERGSYGLYYIQYKKKWWHRWQYIRYGTDDFIRYWETIAGAESYIENELKRLKNS